MTRFIQVVQLLQETWAHQGYVLEVARKNTKLQQ